MLGSGGIIDVLLLLALCGGNYFVLCNRCCTVLSVKQHEKLGRLYSKRGYSGKERNLWKNIFLFLEAVVWLLYRFVQECIWLHLLELLRKIMFVTEKGNKLIRK